MTKTELKTFSTLVSKKGKFEIESRGVTKGKQGHSDLSYYHYADWDGTRWPEEDPAGCERLYISYTELKDLHALLGEHLMEMEKLGVNFND